MLSPDCRSSHISFAISWEVSLVTRNTITHGGAWIGVNRSECATSGDMGTKRDVGRRWMTSRVGRQCRATVDDVGPDVDVEATSQDGSSSRAAPRRKSAPGKYFRYGLATQDLVSHEVHGLRTAIATGNKSLLIYVFGRKRGRSGDRGDARSYIQCSW